MSPEKCLDENDQETTNCDNEGFSRVPPFTDLTYLIYPPNSPSHSKMEIIVIVSTVAGVLVLIGALSVIVWRVRKSNKSHEGYSEIS